MLYMEDIATCGYLVLVWCFWRLVLWCPSYWLARRSLTFGGFGVGFWLMHLEVLEVTVGAWWCFATWMIWRYSWRHFGTIGDLMRLCYDLEIDLETWHLTWSISWVGSQEPCLLVLAYELIMTRMDDVTRWDDDQTDGYAVAVTVHSLFFLQAGSCTLWGLDSSNHSWLDPRERKLGLVKELELLFQLELEKSEKIEVFRIATSILYLMVFINISLSFPFIFGVSLLCDWSIVTMH